MPYQHLYDASSPVKYVQWGRSPTETLTCDAAVPGSGVPRVAHVEQVVVDTTSSGSPRLLISDRVRAALVEAGWRPPEGSTEPSA